MSDHLGIFFDKSTTLEDLLKEQGQTLTHGQTDGNLEIWDDGSLRSSGSGQALPDESAKSESS